MKRTSRDSQTEKSVPKYFTKNMRREKFICESGYSDREGENKRARIFAQLNYRRFLIPRKESRYACAAPRRPIAPPTPAMSSLKIEAIYEHNVKSNTMQTLISRARDISPRAGRCNISRKRGMSLFLSLFFSLLLSRFCLLARCVSPSFELLAMRCH